MTFEERLNAISGLSPSARMAFAAGSAQRAVNEAERVAPEKVRDYPSLRQGVDLLWRQAMGEDIDYNRDARLVHQEASRLIPETEDDPGPDKALRYAGQAVSLGLLAIKEPQRSPKLAAHAGGAMVNLVGNVYEDWKRIQNEERQWQDRAVQFLVEHPGQPITPAIFDVVGEYERGPVSETYRMGLRE
jgi:hypothetical protein